MAPSESPSERRILWAVVLAALLIRLILMAGFQTYLIESDWKFGYETGRIAAAVARGQGFASPFVDPSGPTAWLTPLYPLCLAGLFQIFGVYTTAAAVAVLTVNCLLSAGTCVPLYYLARQLFGRGTGLIAIFIFALYPPSIWHAITTIWDTTAFTFLGVVLLLWLVRLPQGLNRVTAALFGTFLGLLVLISPVILAVYPFLLLWVFRRAKAPGTSRAACLAMMVGLAGLTVLPWMARNYCVFQRPILRANFGLELRLENNARSWQALTSVAGLSAVQLGHPSLDRGEFDRYVSLGEMAYVDQCYREATAWISKHPGRYLWLTGRRICHFWLGDWSAASSWRANLKTGLNFTQIKRLCHVLPLPFALIGLILAVRRKLPVGPLIFFVAFLPVVYYLTHVSQRYRFPIEPVIIVFASYAVSETMKWIVRYRNRRGPA